MAGGTAGKLTVSPGLSSTVSPLASLIALWKVPFAVSSSRSSTLPSSNQMLQCRELTFWLCPSTTSTGACAVDLRPKTVDAAPSTSDSVGYAVSSGTSSIGLPPAARARAKAQKCQTGEKTREFGCCAGEHPS